MESKHIGAGSKKAISPVQPTNSGTVMRKSEKPSLLRSTAVNSQQVDRTENISHAK